jgi:hypothetical protein
MKIEAPSDAELTALALQVDEQLTALQSAPVASTRIRAGSTGRHVDLPGAPDQQAAIEKAAGEQFDTFWQKYKRQARADLCVPGGILYQQWRKWRDLESKAAVRTSYVWLAAMGIPTGSIGPLAVAATVFLLNVIAKIGIEAVCEGADDHAPKSKANQL